VGTVGALLFLWRQTNALRRQIKVQADDRKADEERRQTEFQRSGTAVLSFEGGDLIIQPEKAKVGFTVHADGSGPAHRIVIWLFAVTSSGREHVTSHRIPFLRPPASEQFDFHFPLELARELPREMRVSGFYRNMYGEQVRFTQPAMLRESRLYMTKAPQYVWPWQRKPSSDAPNTLRDTGEFLQDDLK
jgi:hypothetical protein